MANSVINLKELFEGKLICVSCGKGIYQPFNCSYPPEENHYFICNNCGDRIHWDPVVEIN